MFYSVQVTTTSAGTTAKAIFDFATLEAAKANHFYFLSSCYSNSGLDYFLGEILDHDGNVVTREVWYRQEPQTEVTVNEE